MQDDVISFTFCKLEVFMHDELQKQSNTLTIPLNVVKGIVIGLLIILLIYIFSNYVFAASLQQNPGVAATERENNNFQVQDNYAHVIFYRDDSTVLPPEKVLNVFIDEKYHTSILHYTRAVELLLCPGSQALKVALSQHDHHRFSQRAAIEGMSPTLQAGKRYYFQVYLNSQGKIAARVVPESEAKIALAQLKPQIRPLSRVLNEHYCPKAFFMTDSTYVIAQQNRSLSLNAEGHRALARLVRTIHYELKGLTKL
jgi:hypothetical protein